MRDIIIVLLTAGACLVLWAGAAFVVIAWIASATRGSNPD